MYTLKKSLGQHFLRDENISRKIVATVLDTPAFKETGDAPPLGDSPSGQLSESESCERVLNSVQNEVPGVRVLEVGPGAGALTKYLLEIEGLDFKAVELDEEKVLYLKKTWPVLQDKILHESILDIDKPFEGKFTVVGNFPYNISSQILFKMLDWRDSLDSMTGMFQKEVAQRVAAKEGNKVYGVLSVLIQAFFEVKYLFEVSEQCFQPPPKVKSAVILLLPRATPLKCRDEKSFFLLVKTAFNQRRKTLRNAVRGLFDPLVLQDPLFGQRAEQLSVDDFAQLTWKMR
ncbi:MAG TPA: 16S rRNA (adenine(1518)-N(6)/adenine(1519)-N(6))-dimethyltransferase RsmA [Puia sp.]